MLRQNKIAASIPKLEHLSKIAPSMQLSGTLSEIQSVFELAKFRQAADLDGKMVLYSHPNFARSYFNAEISNAVGKAEPDTYIKQNPRVVRYLSRRQHGEKQLLHEDNFTRIMQVAALTGMDMIITIPCKRCTMAENGSLIFTPADGGRGHFSSLLALQLSQLKDLNSPTAGRYEYGQIGFLPTNSSNGKIYSGLAEKIKESPKLRESWQVFKEVISKTSIIPGGGLTHACLEQTLNAIEIDRRQLWDGSPDLLYTDANEGPDGNRLAGGWIRSVFPSRLRTERLNDLFGHDDGENLATPR